MTQVYDGRTAPSNCYKNGDQCPSCGIGSLHEVPNTDGSKEFVCDEENECGFDTRNTENENRYLNSDSDVGEEFDPECHFDFSEGSAVEQEEWPDPTPLPSFDGSATIYPVGALPRSLKKASEEVCRFAKVPPVSPAMVGISAAAVAIGKKAVIIEKPGLEHHPALFFCGIGEPGSRKSDPFKIMTRSLSDWQKSMTPEYERKIIEVKARNQVAELEINAIEKAARGSELSDEDREALISQLAIAQTKLLKEPPTPRLFTTDATEESLFQKMHDREGAFAVVTGEGRPLFDALMGQYKPSGQTGDSMYLSGISGDTICRDRVGNQEERTIFDPCLNVCVFVQPDKYMEAARTKKLRDSGALARIWPTKIPSNFGSRVEQENEPGLNENALTDFEVGVRHLLDSTLRKDESGNLKPHRVTLSADAADARRAWFNIIEKMQGEGEELSDVRDIASKATSTTCKVALVLHLLKSPNLLMEAHSELSLQTWKEAQMIGEFHLRESIRIQRLSVQREESFRAMKLLRWLEAKGTTTFKISEIIQRVPRPRITKVVEKDCASLVENGWLKEVEGSGREKSTYLVNPAIANLAKFATDEV